MSFLFHKKTKKVANIAWTIIAVLVALGMVITFAPGIANLFLQ